MKVMEPLLKKNAIAPSAFIIFDERSYNHWLIPIIDIPNVSAP
jgi:hypothetical protein